MSVTATAVASRTSGPAPFALHVSAVTSTSTTTTDTYRNCRFEWDFDDSANAIAWSRGTRTSLSSNTEEGPVQGHIYTTPGSYTITLTVTDEAGDTDTDTIAVTVSDPESALTMHVYTDEASPGWTEGVDYPTGATTHTSATWSTMTGNWANNTWHMWKRGRSVSSSGGQLAFDNLMISSIPSSYGAGADVQFTGSGTISLGDAVSTASTDCTFWEVDFSGQSAGQVIARNNACSSGWTDLTVYDCKFDDHQIYAGEQNSGATKGDGLYVVNCTWVNSRAGSQSILASANDAWIAGCQWNWQATCQQHLRNLAPHRMAFCHNEMLGGPDGRSMLRINGSAFSTSADVATHIYVADSVFDLRGATDGDNVWWMQLSAVDTTEDGRLDDILVERCYFICHDTNAKSSRVDIGGCNRLSMRRNVVAALGVAQIPTSFQLRNQGSQRNNDDCAFWHNTIYADSTVSVVCALVDYGSGTHTNIDVRNNLGLNDGTGGIDFSRNGVPGTESNNVDESGDTVSTVFEAASPSVFTEFDLVSPNADVIGQGADINDDLPDALLRDVDATPDVGAFQYTVGGGGGGGGSTKVVIVLR